MLGLTLTLAFVLLSTGASAQSRPVTTAMTCSQAAGLVASRGAVVMNTGPHTYDRYVSGGNFCALGEFADPAWVPSADSQQCFVGYRCVSRAFRQSSR
jgi:hypothetical protein